LYEGDRRWTVSGRVSAGRAGSRRAGTLAAVAAGIAVLAAACGGGGGPAGPAGPPDLQQMVAYSQCMRSHGAPFWPDPSQAPGGTWDYKITPQSSQQERGPGWHAALKACQKLAPKELPFTEAQIQAALPKLLKLAKCMRAHGITSFPDPIASPDFIGFKIPAGADPHSPRFQAARQACRAYAPGP
jgi:hypothetical protein